MNIKDKVAVITGKSSYKLLHDVFHKGSSFPGMIAQKISPNVLSELANDYEVIIVSGTNGKTLTTALIVKVLQQKYDYVLTNETGSNMMQGIITTFITKPKLPSNAKKIAVLEVDEANVLAVAQLVKPIAFVTTNIFRDQMDRFGEIYTTYDKVIAGIKSVPTATVIANGDTPIFHSKNLPNNELFYGFNTGDPNGDLIASPNTDGVLCPVCHHILHYHFITYANLGDYFCPNCGFKRPALTYSVDSIIHQTPTSSTFTINNLDYSIKIGGTYNIYNALAAYSVGKFLGISDVEIKTAFNQNEKVFGRQEVLEINGKKVTLILVKNPVGLNQVIDMILKDDQNFGLVSLINDNYADGIDVSWIWDGEFERLNIDQVKSVITGGAREKDIHFRMKVAGFAPEQLISASSIDDVVNKISETEEENVYVLATYTAVLELREALNQTSVVQKNDNLGGEAK